MLTPEEVAEAIHSLEARYRFVGIVGDPGGLGAKFVEALRRRFAIPITAAEKTTKMGAIELMNGDLRTGRMLIVEPANRDLVHDAANLQWNWQKVDEKKHGGNVERSDLLIDHRVPDHLTDAWTYAYRECRHYFAADDETRPHPPIGSAEYAAWLEEQELEQAIEEPDDWLEGDFPDEDPFSEPLGLF